MNLFTGSATRTSLSGWEELTQIIRAMQRRGQLFPYAILVLLAGIACMLLVSPQIGLGIMIPGMILCGMSSPIEKETIPTIRAKLEALLLSGDPPTLVQALCVLSTSVITSEQEQQVKQKLVPILRSMNAESAPLLTDREKAAFDALLLSRNSGLVVAAKAASPYFSQANSARHELLRGSQRNSAQELLHPSEEMDQESRELLRSGSMNDEKTKDASQDGQ